MFKPQMIENEKDFYCYNNHEQAAHMVVLDPKLDKKKRLLCTQCIEHFKSDGKTIGLKEIIQIIENIIEKRLSNQEKITQSTVQQLKICTRSIQELKAQFMKLFDFLINIAEDWTQNLLAQIQQSKLYSFYDELDSFIKSQNDINNSNITFINNINKYWMTKLYENLDQYIKNKDKVNFKEIKQQFNKIICSNQSQKSEIQLQLIDQSVKQRQRCQAIVFDPSGSIMVSTQQSDIIVWSFLNGTITSIQTLQGHTDWIQCLVQSRKQNSFVSGAMDSKIRCWKQYDSTNWISSQPYQQHKDCVRCIILNSNEDLLFSGSNDKSIKLWKVDFNQNILTYMYSLDKHDNSVIALSLNQSETQLVSCAKDKNQIIIWERREQNKYKFKYFVKQSIQDQGKKVLFIKDYQFIWITGGEQIDKFYVFELKQGIFQENQEKTIQFITNNQIVDEYHFPMIYNKERNFIIVRHKTYIYIIREMKDGKFKIVDQLNCETYDIYGTITNNGQYLVFWDGKNEGYSTYEL
ncbi:unnamed protein product [Paramecium pentaurelia]|uniref:WD40-repeat-containing domain n=1 Tax=Paramecium pentaurelia TaxID=43138 RepID=A0A8S1YDU2_9CILI|nr:unnamed protein product [Paramecium pentaurelia]